MSDACLRAALAYAAEGLRVFPLHSMRGSKWACSCGTPCDSPGKHPRTLNGCKDATTDRHQIGAWWREWPDANIGVATGDGLLVIDLDGDEGCVALAEVCEAHGQLPITRYVRTGREGGFHLWYRAEGPGVRNTTGNRAGLAAGIDTRGEGGYVLAPPSNHESGRRYVGDDLPIADAPSWLLDLLTPKVIERTASAVVPVISTETTPYGRRAIELECEKVRTAPEGTRNDQLNASAYSLGQLEAGGQIAYGDAGPALEDAASAAGLPSRQSWTTIYKSGLVKGRANPRRAPESTKRRPERAVAPPDVRRSTRSPPPRASSRGRATRTASQTSCLHSVARVRSPTPTRGRRSAGRTARTMNRGKERAALAPHFRQALGNPLEQSPRTALLDHLSAS
jgi:hypothetical protein